MIIKKIYNFDKYERFKIFLFAFYNSVNCFLSIHFKDIFSYTTLVYAYGVIPLFELIFKPKSYEEKRVVSSDLKNIFFDSLLYLNFPIVTSLLFYGFNVLSFENTFFYEEMGIVLSLAILLATNGINVAHETLVTESQVLLRIFLKVCCCIVYICIFY